MSVRTLQTCQLCSILVSFMAALVYKVYTSINVLALGLDRFKVAQQRQQYASLMLQPCFVYTFIHPPTSSVYMLLNSG